MLYVSTRNKTDSYTSHRALHADRAPDGGAFVPFQLPYYPPDALDVMKKNTFAQNIAQVLNVFFATRLSGWDIEFCIGRHPVKLKAMNHRLLFAELWHNLQADYSYFEQSVYSRLCSSYARKRPTVWAQIAIRIALLFALGCEVLTMGIASFDISVTVLDPAITIAAWYARKMGLPVQTIICSCNENCAAWDLLCNGEFNPAFTAHSPPWLEQHIYNTLGYEETQHYLEAVAHRRPYLLDDEQRYALNADMYAEVISDVRLPSVVNSVFRANNYLIDVTTARPYGGLQDYRSRFGESKYTLILSDTCPLSTISSLASVLNIPEDTLKGRFQKSGE